MRSKPDPEAVADVDAATAMILAADQTTPGWQRRAVGTDAQAALAQIPGEDYMATIQTRMLLANFRVLQRHIAGRNVNQALWLREAAVDKFLREGGDIAAAVKMLDVAFIPKRRDVPRDHHGQPRRREGRRT